ncbi:MAG TPA: tetratricopeptide repeat protein [Abditibacteriaceae bacterium]|nr:tetratricopeptide repeat protein [Abditibacteriaceae bacterium]
MTRLLSTVTDRRNRAGLIWGVVIGLLILGLLNLLLQPDIAGNYFTRAQSFEAKGQWELALRHYDMIIATHPKSSYAPRALNQKGDILSGLARRAGDQAGFRRAIATYEHLATAYPENPLAGEALLSAGAVAMTDLHDTKTARRIYTAIKDRYPNNQEYSSESLLRLGRIALMERNGKQAESLFKKVLQRYPRFVDRCAEARYHLGVVYETLLKNKEWARNAYEATLNSYPQSIWAGNARERLGLLVYEVTRGLGPARRVLLEVAPLPDESSDAGSLLGALRLLLAARGIEAGDAVLRGWSSAPFYCGFVPSRPERVVTAPFNAVENIAASAGLRFVSISSADKTSALQALQREIDLARLPVVYDNGWTLAVGYDSDRNQVFLQNHGARFETVAVKDFSATWQKAPPGGKSFTLLSFHAPGERSAAKPTPRALSVTDDIVPTPRPTATPLPGPATTPTWIFQLKPLSMNNAHRRALRHAVSLMRNPGSDKTLLNLAALEAISGELARLAVRPISPVPVPEGGVSDEFPDPDAPLQEQPATDPTPVARSEASRNVLPRTRAVLGWFGAPLQRWINARREAAAYLDSAGNALDSEELSRAAGEFQKSITALQNAAAAVPRADSLSGDGQTLSDNARRGLESAAREVAAARDAERRAVTAMSRAG